MSAAPPGDPDAFGCLRAKLAALRAGLLARLARHITARDLARLGDVELGLIALDEHLAAADDEERAR